jgi:cell shape-determining protein MreC
LLGLALAVTLLAGTSALWGVRVVASAVNTWAVSWRTFAARVQAPEESTFAQLALCEGERASYAARLAEEQVTRKEYQEAELLFARPRNEAWRLVAGRVVALAAGASQWRVRLDVGGEDGVGQGQAVLGPAGSLLGIVEKAQERSSIVRYTGAAATRLAVSTVGNTVTLGLLEGTDGEEMVVRYIPRGASVKAGDVLVTSGLTSEVPIGLPVAIVKDIIDNESDPFLTARAVPLERSIDVTTVAVVVL